MRFLSALINDIRFQLKYGFYYLYALISAIYVVILLISPVEYKAIIASVIILTDPAMLGTFFIGGIWLLEKSEGLHLFWQASPLLPMEYVLSKVSSLAVISSISSILIIFFGLGTRVNCFLLTAGVFIGSMIFTCAGLLVATFARSVNQYMLLASPLEVVVTLPAFLVAFGVSHPALDFFPGAALYHIILSSIEPYGVANGASRDMPAGSAQVGALSYPHGYGVYVTTLFVILIIWLVAALYFARRRVTEALIAESAAV